MDNPNFYIQNNQIQRKDAEYMLERFGPILKNQFKDQEISLIDIGSGCGSVLYEVIVPKSELNFFNVVGTDINPEMIDHATKKYKDDRFSFQLMDISGDIPENLKNHQFDMATSIYCLHFVTDLKKALANIHELLKPNGIFCCLFLQWYEVVTAYGNLAKIYPEYMKNWKTAFSPLWQEEYPEKVWKKYLEETGFEIIELLDIKDFKHDLRNKENFLNHFKAVEPFSKQMSEEEKQKYLINFEKVFWTNRIENFILSGRLMFILGRKI